MQSSFRICGALSLSILRIMTASLFMQAGTTKLFAFPASILPDGGTVPIWSLHGLAGIMETFGGLFLLVGLYEEVSRIRVPDIRRRDAGPWSSR